MPAIAPITVNDGTSDHVFNPRGVDNSGLATLTKSSGVPVADERLTVGRSRTSQGREKVTIKFVLPVVATETVNGVDRPSIVRTAYADLQLTFDGTSTAAERTIARRLVSDLLTETPIASVIDNLENLY